MYCSNCGKENPDGSRFCSECGTTFGENPSATGRIYQIIWRISRWKRVPVSSSVEGDQVNLFWTDKKEGDKRVSFNRQELVAADIATGASISKIITCTIGLVALIFIIYLLNKYSVQTGFLLKLILIGAGIGILSDYISAWKTHLNIRLRGGEKYCFNGNKAELREFRDEVAFRLSGVEKKGGGKSVAKIVVSIICLIVVVVSVIIATTSFDGYNVVQQVKEANGSSVGYSQISYGYAYDTFLSNATWSAEVDEAGNDVVVVRGGCEFLDEPVTAVVKFTLNESEGTFSMTSLLLDGESQGELMRAGMQAAVFESAAENLGIEKDS